MKLVKITEKVKHDSKIFYPGEVRMMEDDEAAYFAKHGWGEAEGVAAGALDKSPKVLQVQDGGHVGKTKVG